ncbi:hypothetical protein ACROYT_G009074 [Oculina patagonica]
MYDFINLGKKGVNWASNLDAYNRILNEESKEELGWKSPFEVYFGRKSNILVKESLDEAEVDMDNCIVKTPKRKDYNRHFGNVKKLRKRALRYSRRMNERMVKRYARLCKTPAYKRGDEVLVRYRPDRRGNIPPKRRVVLKGTIVKKGKTNAMYKVRIVPPKSEKEIEKWVSIEDIANLQNATVVIVQISIPVATFNLATLPRETGSTTYVLKEKRNRKTRESENFLKYESSNASVEQNRDRAS